jgi:hypothetical protein
MRTTRLGWVLLLGGAISGAIGCSALEEGGDDDVPLEGGRGEFDAGPVIRPTRPGTAGAGAAGFPGFAGTGPGICGIDIMCPVGGGFPVPPGMCFECSAGCFDCGMGCFCDNPPEPTAPFWTPPFEDVGDTGWRESEDPVCVGMPDVGAIDMTADESGVHLVVSGYGPESFALDDSDGGVALGDFESLGFPGAGKRDGGVNPFEFLPRTRVLRNRGDGWVRRAEMPGSSFDVLLRSLGRGTLALAIMPGGDSVTCPLGVIREDELECLAVDPLTDIVRVSDTLGYALMLGTRLIRWDGDQWRGDGDLLPYPARVLWADGDDVLAFGTAGTVLRKASVGWELVNVDSFESFTAVWGESADDLWLGTSNGKVLHFDGESVDERYELGGTTCDSMHPIVGLYGSGDVLYMHSVSQLQRVEIGDDPEVLGDWSCQFGGPSQEIVALAGTGPDDVFVAMRDLSVGSDCGSVFVAYFDGDEFHRM